MGADRPLAYWRLDESSGASASDVSGNGLAAAYVGGVGLGVPGAPSGESDPAIALDGNTGAVIRNPFGSFPTAAVSVELWLQTSDSAKAAGIFSYAAPGSDNEFQLRDYRNLTIYRGTSTLATGVSANDGLWHQLVVSWRGSDGQTQLFKDGKLAFTGTLAPGTAINGAGGAVVLGQDQDWVGGGFDPAQAVLGNLDEVSLYPALLSADRVAAHYAAASGSPCSPVAGASGQSYTLGAADLGQTMRVVVTASNVAGSSSAPSANTAVVTSASGSSASGSPSGDTGATGYRTLVPPAFTPQRTLIATTPAEFLSDLANLAPGDLVDVRPMTLSGEIVVNKALSDYAEIHFEPGVQFVGTAWGSQLPAVWIKGAQNIRLYGGDLTNPGGKCIWIQDSTNVLWWGWKAHGCGADGLFATNVSKGSSGLDFDGEISNCGLDLSQDPHAEIGTGIHGAYLGATGGSTTGATSGKFSLYVHDQPTGAALQLGSNLVNSELWLKAVNITFQAQSQVAGDALQWWGGDVNNVTVHKVTGDYLAGRMSETNGMYASGNSNIVVEYGRGTGILANPLLARIAYATDPAVSYQDISPSP